MFKNSEISNLQVSFPFFPIPGKGETVYSLFCRCFERSGIPHTHLLKEFTWQRNYASLLSALPGNISLIAAKMPIGHPWCEATTIARSHTSLSYFTYFDTKRERTREIEKLSKSGPSQPTILALGLTSYSHGMIPTSPRYCPTCTQTDRDTFGFPMYRREHQLPGVAVCWQHRTVLAHGCTRCGTYPIKGRALSMAGKCFCDKITPLQAYTHLPRNTEPLLWLAKQSAFMVNSSGTNSRNIRATLRNLAISQGLSRGSLLDTGKLASALEGRFGTETLQWAGAPAWENGHPAAWLRRLLNPPLNDVKRSPALLFLLVIGIFHKSMDAFETSQMVSMAENPRPGILPPQEMFAPPRQPPWADEVRRLLESGKCGLPGISKRLGIPVGKLIKEIQQHNWCVPLSPQTRKNLGDEKILSIQDDLKNGDPKTEIMRRYGCSEWALTLIELDSPGLNAAHRKAASLRTKSQHRNRLLAYLADSPAATRTDATMDLPVTYDYLVRQDKDWLYDQIPRRRKGKIATRKDRVDWVLLDRAIASKLNAIFNEMLASTSKPVRASATAALKQAGILRRYFNNPYRFPLVTETLRHRSESRSEFVKRRLAWAVKVMVKEKQIISLNKLRRAAALPAEVVREHKKLIISVGGDLGAEFDNHSYFSQWKKYNK